MALPADLSAYPLAALPAALPTSLPVTQATSGAPVGTPLLWTVTLLGVLALLAVDFGLTRSPHAVSMREAILWSSFYVALPLAFGVWVWTEHGAGRGVEYYTGYLVEKSLSVDNLFVLVLLLAGFAVPRELRQRVLLIGVAGALVLRGVLIAVGGRLIESFDVTFLLFGALLLATAASVLRDTLRGAAHEVDVTRLRSVRLVRRFWPVSTEYAGTALTVRRAGRRALTPLALVVVAILGADVVFAVDSVPAVYGITGDPYLVFVTNAFALLGLRALYFVLEGALARLAHLGYGLAAILAVIGAKLVLHWAHGVWPAVPTVPTLAGLAAVVAILATVTATSLVADRRGGGRGAVDTAREAARR